MQFLSVLDADSRDVRILEFRVCVCVCKMASESASGKLSIRHHVRVRTVSNSDNVKKIYWNPGPTFNNVAFAKKLRMQLKFCSIVVAKK